MGYEDTWADKADRFPAMEHSIQEIKDKARQDALKEVGELLKPDSEAFMGGWLKPIVKALCEGRMP